MCVSLRPSLSCLSCSIWFTRLPAPHLCLRAPSSLFSLPSSLHLLLSPSFSSFFPHPSFFLWQIMQPNQKAEFVGLYSFASYRGSLNVQITRNPEANSRHGDPCEHQRSPYKMACEHNAQCNTLNSTHDIKWRRLPGRGRKFKDLLFF